MLCFFRILISLVLFLLCALHCMSMWNWKKETKVRAEIIRKFRSLFQMISDVNVKPIIFQLDLLGSSKHHGSSFCIFSILSNSTPSTYDCTPNLQTPHFYGLSLRGGFIICVYPNWMAATSCNLDGKFSREKSLLFLCSFQIETIKK